MLTMQFFAALLLWNFAAWCLFSHRLVAGHQFYMIALRSLSSSQSHSSSLISQNELLTPTTPFYFYLKHKIYPAKMLKITLSYREDQERCFYLIQIAVNHQGLCMNRCCKYAEFLFFMQNILLSCYCSNTMHLLYTKKS